MIILRSDWRDVKRVELCRFRRIADGCESSYRQLAGDAPSYSLASCDDVLHTPGVLERVLIVQAWCARCGEVRKRIRPRLVPNVNFARFAAHPLFAVRSWATAGPPSSTEATKTLELFPSASQAGANLVLKCASSRGFARGPPRFNSASVRHGLWLADRFLRSLDTGGFHQSNAPFGRHNFHREQAWSGAGLDQHFYLRREPCSCPTPILGFPTATGTTTRMAAGESSLSQPQHRVQLRLGKVALTRVNAALWRVLRFAGAIKGFGRFKVARA